ncbi:MAG: protein TolR [Gammaproteobacteria bacterium]|nr:protein TolR [Gammaproteobacteria bacterium]NNJ73244.1 protein TolR [Enterobacterales bacterium]
MSKTKKRRKPVAEINVVPYIDVMLVLLIIFMVTAPLITAGVNVTLPVADAEPMPSDDEPPLVASIDRSGNYYLSIGDSRDQSLTEDELIALVQAQQEQNPQIQIVVNGDKDVPYGRVVRLMVLLQQEAGIETVGLMTDPLEDN